MALKRALCLVGLVCLLVTGCSADNSINPAAPRPHVAALTDVNDSFGVQLDRDGRPLVLLKKNSLEKEFLLQGSLMKQPIVGWSECIKSRVVAFRKYQGRIYMLEATKGHSVTSDLQQTLPLFSFPIQEETAQGYIVDFATGLQRVYNTKDWRGSDGSAGREYQQEFASIPITNGFIEKAQISGNALVIRQVGSGSNETGPLAVKYYLSPYHPDSTFEPMVSQGFEKTGFFEAAPFLLPGGGTVVRVAKHNHRKPIVWALSANTPPEYRQAIKDGVLYWNRAFNSPVVQVVDAPAEVSAPDFNYNVVQWVPWDEAPYAYADMQMDPRTGQILHAQVYISSEHAVRHLRAAQRIVNRARGRARPPGGGTAHAHAELQGEHLCNGETAEAQASSYAALITSGASAASVLRASQDNIRRVTAHEVGHALGLRHHFAANINARNYPLVERPRIFRDYLAGTPLPENMEVATAVMDYHQMEEGAFIGHRIGRGLPALSHDRKAIQVLYYASQAEDDLIYCTDSDLRTYVDCVQRDAGISPVEFAALIQSQKLETLHHDILSEFISARMPELGAPATPIARVSIEPNDLARDTLAIQNGLLSVFYSGPAFLFIRRQFPFLNSVNSSERADREWNYLVAEIGRVGGADGLKKVFPIPSFEKVKRSEQLFLQSIDPLNASSLFGTLGLSFTFSASEVATMRTNVGTVYSQLSDKLAASDLDVWSKAPNSWKHPTWGMAGYLAQALAERVRVYTMATTGETIDAVLHVPPILASTMPFTALPIAIPVRLPVYAYSEENRVLAARLITPGTGSAVRFGTAEKAAAKAELLAAARAALGGLNPETTDLNQFFIRTPANTEDVELTRKVKSWLAEVKEVIKGF